MQILINEIKKILTWKIALLLIIVNCILFFLLIIYFGTPFSFSLFKLVFVSAVAFSPEESVFSSIIRIFPCKMPYHLLSF